MQRSGPHSSAQLLSPRVSLAGCLFGAVVRDTRRLALDEAHRFNFFPASPLCTMSWFFEGASHLASLSNTGMSEGSIAINEAPEPAMFVTGPQRRPVISWNPGSVYAMTVAFYPEAWSALFEGEVGSFVDRTAPFEEVARGPMLDLLREVMAPGDAPARFRRLEDILEPIWRRTRPAGGQAAYWLQDWARALALRAATSAAGQSARQVQRRIKAWTGLNQRELNALSRTEKMFAAASQLPSPATADLAQFAVETGFADQSHMGRHVRRVTGLSPSRLGAMIHSHEPLWCYRLLGERF